MSLENTIIAPVSTSATPMIFSEILKKSKEDVIFILQNDREIEEFAKNLKFFSVNSKILPDFDKSFYEQTPTSPKIIDQRISSICSMASNERKILITSLKAISRKQVPISIIKSQIFTLKKGSNLERQALIEKLIHAGYERENMVSDSGDFAVRGNIIDIFPISFEKPIRVDFFSPSSFDERPETIKLFDVDTQISLKDEDLDEVNILPASEIILNDETIKNFQQCYRENFSIKASSDQSFESISQGRKFTAMENFLPFFYKDSCSVFDYFNSDNLTIFSNSDSLSTLYDNLFDQITESFEFKKNFSKDSLSNSQKFLDPSKIFLTKEEFQGSLSRSPQIALMQFYLQKNDFVYVESKISNMNDLSKMSLVEKRSNFEILKSHLLKDKKQIIACRSSGSRNRIENMLEQNNITSKRIKYFFEAQENALSLAILDIENGYVGEDFQIISEKDLLGEKLSNLTSIRKKKNSQKRLENILNEASSLESGDLIVHQDHGIGRFESLESMEIRGFLHDFLKISYHNNDKLYLPVENIELISKYGENQSGELDRLGQAAWQMRKARMKGKLQDIAKELIKMAAIRKTKLAPIIQVNSSTYEEFTDKFPYAETEDQLKAIDDVLSDLSRGYAMDRLICGDVGFGKTEVAIRAAFATIMAENSSHQVALLVPTTLLARQHYEVFKSRMSEFNIRVATISRMVSPKDIRETKEKLKQGKIDIVIGTHALLSKDLEFANLSLLIIDEEQAFGVLQKEKIKQMSKNVHLLSMSATPIPRTLQMSLLSIKDLSLIATPPIDRLPIQTSVLEFDPLVIRQAILSEFNRGGKIFYVAPRIADLDWIAKTLQEIIPKIPFVICHGQMKPSEIDQRTQDFSEGKYSILLSTSIIESGIDIEGANTIIIHRADMFGLSALYQLRGRVGRRKLRAHSYLTVKSSKLLTKTAMKRLEVLSSIDSLGAGFSIASSDMDNRGFGNLLGSEQAGNVKEIGAELYQQMLQDAIKNLNEEESQPENDWSPSININLPVLIPESYIGDLSLRLGLYKRISLLTSKEEIDAFLIEMTDRFGEFPVQVQNLLDVADLKNMCKLMQIKKLDLGSKAIILSFKELKDESSQNLISLAVQKAHKYKIKQDQKLLIFGSFSKASEIKQQIEKLSGFIL